MEVKLIKKLFKLLVVVFLICTCIAMVSCSSSSSNEEQQSAVYTLSSDEKEKYNSIIGSISSFKDSSSVTLITVYEKAFIGRYIKISGKNSYGGIVTTIYRITSHSLVDANGVDISLYDPDPTISVSKINVALNEYKKGKGWN